MGLLEFLPGLSAGETGQNILVGAVYLFAGFILFSFAALTLVVLILSGGGASDGATQQAADISSPTPASDGGTPAPTPTARPTPTPTDVPTPAPSPDVEVAITYDGPWQGSVSITTDGQSTSRTVDGSGRRVIDVSDDVLIVSANAQKQNRAPGNVLIVTILVDGEPVARSQTSAEYGVAQVSDSFY